MTAWGWLFWCGIVAGALLMLVAFIMSRPRAELRTLETREVSPLARPFLIAGAWLFAVSGLLFLYVPNTLYQAQASGGAEPGEVQYFSWWDYTTFKQADVVLVVLLFVAGYNLFKTDRVEHDVEHPLGQANPPAPAEAERERAMHRV